MLPVNLYIKALNVLLSAAVKSGQARLDAFYFGCTLSCRGNLAYIDKHPKTSSTKTVK